MSITLLSFLFSINFIIYTYKLTFMYIIKFPTFTASNTSSITKITRISLSLFFATFLQLLLHRLVCCVNKFEVMFLFITTTYILICSHLHLPHHNLRLKQYDFLKFYVPPTFSSVPPLSTSSHQCNVTT